LASTGRGVQSIRRRDGPLLGCERSPFTVAALMVQRQRIGVADHLRVSALASGQYVAARRSSRRR
jgi:hypothetical protein